MHHPASVMHKSAAAAAAAASAAERTIVRYHIWMRVFIQVLALKSDTISTLSPAAGLVGQYSQAYIADDCAYICHHPLSIVAAISSHVTTGIHVYLLNNMLVKVNILLKK